MDPDSNQPGSGDTEPPIAKLLERMQGGDRHATAEFMQTYAPLLRRRIRWKLGAGTRRIFDSEEILATFGRRLDQQIHRGALEVRSEGEFWALVRSMLEHTIIDKVRLTTRIQSAEAQAARSAGERHSGGAGDSAIDDSIERALHSVLDDDDRRLLALWMRGVTHAESAASMNLTPGTVRKRWQRLLGRLRDAMRDRGAPS